MKPKKTNYRIQIDRAENNEFFARVVSKYRPKKPIWVTETYVSKQMLKKSLAVMPKYDIEDLSLLKRGRKPGSVKLMKKKMMA